MYLRIDFNKRTYVRQPSFNRNRLPLRGPISSQHVNLEDQQLSYDIANVGARVDSMTSTINTDYAVIEDLLTDITESLRQLQNRLTFIEEN